MTSIVFYQHKQLNSIFLAMQIVMQQLLFEVVWNIITDFSYFAIFLLSTFLWTEVKLFQKYTHRHHTWAKGNLRVNGLQKKFAMKCFVFLWCTCSAFYCSYLECLYLRNTSCKRHCFDTCGYHLQQNGPHHVKGYWKLCQKMVSLFVYHFVWGHLGVLKDVFYHSLTAY